MAKALNKNRILGSKLILASSLGIVLFSRQFWGEENPIHEIFEMIGLVLVMICALGRVYATAYLGGFKNDELITHGIYSLMRNPLYFFTLLGVTGIAFMSNHMSVMIILPLSFMLLYRGLIQREQSFLEEKFGDAYIEYKERVPAMFPNFDNYQSPVSLEFYPRFLNKAFMDAIWWASALPIIEFAEYLQTTGLFPVYSAG